MDHDLLRYVAQITISYLQHNSVASSDLPNLVEIIGRALLKFHGKQQMPRPPNWIADSVAPGSKDLLVGLESHPRSKPVGWVVLAPNEYGGKRSSRSKYQIMSPAESALRLTMARHIGLVEKMLADRERLGLSGPG